MIKHYLLTNLDYDSFDRDVFERYCLGSIRRQGSKNFIWLVGIDYRIPSYIWEDWADCQQFQNIIIGPTDDFVEKAQNWINNDILDVVSENSLMSHVVTTQVRWDQGISRDFVNIVGGEVLRKRVRTGTGIVINPANGIYINTLTKVARQESLVSGLSPFVSLAEPIQEINTVMGYERWALKEPFPVVNIRDHPLWVRVIHRQNSVKESQMNTGKFRINPRLFRFLPSKYLNQVLNTSGGITERPVRKIPTRRKTIYNVHGRTITQ